MAELCFFVRAKLARSLSYSFWSSFRCSQLGETNPTIPATPKTLRHHRNSARDLHHQRKRSFDQYFGQFPVPMEAQPEPPGQTITLERTPEVVVDIGHDWNSAITSVDGGKMDQL